MFNEKNFFVLILVIVLSLFIFTETVKAVDPPIGCSCPGPGGTCDSGPSHWVSATQYQGYYYCNYTDGGCPGSVLGWREISRTGEAFDSHGCDSPTCEGGDYCAVTGILWERIPAPTCTLKASKTSVVIGDSFDLIWTTDSATSATIDHGVGLVMPTIGGTKTITPAITGSVTYKLTAPGIIPETITCQTTVDITPPSCTLTANPMGVYANNSTYLSWNIIGGAALPHASINNGVGAISSLSGSKSTSKLKEATTFTLSFTGSDAAAYSCSADVAIVTPPPPPTGGLVPCGRLADNPDTDDIIESDPCSICALFYLLKNIINFILTLAIGIGVFIFVIAGLTYALSAGNSGRIELAKSAIYSVIVSLTIIFAAWIIIAAILAGMGYANITTWNQVNCVLK